MATRVACRSTILLSAALPRDLDPVWACQGDRHENRRAGGHCGRTRPPDKGSWTLHSGGVQYQLRESDRESACRGSLRPPHCPAEPADFWPDLRGRVERQDVSPRDLRLVDVAEEATDGRKLQLTFGSGLPLEILAQYVAWDETGTITRQLTLVNRGSRPCTWNPSLRSPGGFRPGTGS